VQGDSENVLADFSDSSANQPSSQSESLASESAVEQSALLSERSSTVVPTVPADDLAVAETPEFVEEYAVPSWAEFRTFVMENGNKYVRASYPDAPADLIETIWCGVPVMQHEQARVMTPGGEWLVC
jgi:hypothetical protein